MDENVQYVTITDLYERGWLGQIFEFVCQDMMAVNGRPRTARAILSARAPEDAVRTVHSIVTVGEYPPVCPEDIVKIVTTGNRFRKDYVVNEYVKLANSLKRIIPPYLKELTGNDFVIR